MNSRLGVSARIRHFGALGIVVLRPFSTGGGRAVALKMTLPKRTDGRSQQTQFEGAPRAFAVILLVAAVFLFAFVQRDELIVAPLVVTCGAIIGYMCAGYRGALPDTWTCRYFDKSEQTAKDVGNVELKGFVEGNFI